MKKIRKKRKERMRRDEVEIAVAPRPTAKMAEIKKGLRVRKSKIIAITNVEAAISNEKFNLLFKRYM